MGLVVIGLTGAAAVEKSLCAEYLHREWGATRLHLPVAANSPEGWRSSIEGTNFPPAADGSTTLVVVDDLVNDTEVAEIRQIGGIILAVDDAGDDADVAAGQPPDLRVPADGSVVAMLTAIDEIAAGVMD